MIVLDASVAIAYLEPEDAHHDRATDLLRAGGGDDLGLHAVNAAEVLVGPVRHGVAAEVVQDWAAVGLAVVQTDDDSPVRLASLRVRTGLKLPDCCVLDVALQKRAAVATFDERLARAGRELGLHVVGTESAGGA